MFGYYITDDQGRILTSVKNPRNLQWTVQAQMEEGDVKAVTYKNPYQIPRSVSAKLKDDFLVYKVETGKTPGFASFEETLSGQCVGMYGQFKSGVPSMKSFQRDNARYHERAWHK